MADMTQLKSSDNAVLHDIIAELCKHLTAHILPKLKNWLDIATNALKILRKREEGRGGDSAVAEGGRDTGTAGRISVTGAGSVLGKRSYGDIVSNREAAGAGQRAVVAGRGDSVCDGEEMQGIASC